MNVNADGAKTRIRTICDWILEHMSVLMSIALIAYGIFGMIYYYGEDHLYGFAINIMPIISGLLILLDKHRSIFWAVGLYGIGIGASRLIKYLPGVFADDIFTFVYNVIFAVMAGNLVYSGIRYIRGNARSIIFVILGSTAFVVLTGITLAYELNEYDNLADFLYFNTGYLVNMAVYMMYMGLVWSEPVRKSTDVSIALSLSSGIRGVDGTMRRASINRSVVQNIVDFIEGKGSSNSGPLEGPIYSEYCFSYNDKYKTNYASLQRWNGPDGDLYLTLTDHNKGSFIGTTSMLVTGMESVGDALIIKCADRGEAVFSIKDIDEEDGPIFYKKSMKTGGEAA